MRVQGNVYPESITVETYLPIPGMVEVRLRENVTQLEDNLYEYDEYTIRLPAVTGLKEKIVENLQDWLYTFRELEVSANASILFSMKKDINAYEQALSEIEAALGVSG